MNSHFLWRLQIQHKKKLNIYVGHTYTTLSCRLTCPLSEFTIYAQIDYHIDIRQVFVKEMLLIPQMNIDCSGRRKKAIALILSCEIDCHFP